MRFNVFFTVKGPAGVIDAPNNTNPVGAADLASLLRLLADKLPNNSMLGIEVVGLRIDPVAGPAEDFDPISGENLTGKVEPCCECGEDYPRANLILRGEIFCPACQAKEKR